MIVPRFDFDEWLSKKTEFSEKDFFDKAMALTIGFDLTEIRGNHFLKYVGLTTPQKVSFYDDDCIYHEKNVRLNYVLEFVFNSDCCHISCNVDGCGEHYGLSYPLKLFKELVGIDDIPYSDKLVHTELFNDIRAFFM